MWNFTTPQAFDNQTIQKKMSLTLRQNWLCMHMCEYLIEKKWRNSIQFTSRVYGMGTKWLKQKDILYCRKIACYIIIVLKTTKKKKKIFMAIIMVYKMVKLKRGQAWSRIHPTRKINTFSTEFQREIQHFSSANTYHVFICVMFTVDVWVLFDVKFEGNWSTNS